MFLGSINNGVFNSNPVYSETKKPSVESVLGKGLIKALILIFKTNEKFKNLRIAERYLHNKCKCKIN